MGNDYYQDFIKEAFVDSIRSVLIIDDDYPTYDEVLWNQHELNMGEQVDKDKDWYRSPERIREVIQKFRKNNPSLLVDIHDGKNVAPEADNTVANHLHQSDLLVLDYQLDKSKQGDGTRAIEILRYLMSNDHFNLVIVYTNEDLDEVFDVVRLGLLGPSFSHFTNTKVKETEELIESVEVDFPEIMVKIYKSVGNEQYFHSRLHSSTYLRTMAKGNQPYSEFFDLCTQARLSREQQKLVLPYILRKFENSKLGIMNAETPEDNLKWSTKSAKWIRGKSIFIGFSKKSDDSNPINELQTAINDWKPNPSRLFLTKLRSSIDEYGVVAQAQAMNHTHALAYWYERLLKSDDLELRWRIAESVTHHSDRLMEVIIPRVEDFAIRLLEKEAVSGNINERCLDHFKVDLNNDEIMQKAVREHNAFVCSRSPKGWHLTTGHIFKIGGEHWICLSPACDMVPSQLSPYRIQITGDRLPFIAVRLNKIDKMPSKVNSNRYIFLQTDNDVEIYCFNNPSGDDSAPHWETLYAENFGKFRGDSFQFRIWQARAGKTKPIFKYHTVTVVSQLRYEYALNLIQKLGSSLTRIGLDFTDEKLGT